MTIETSYANTDFDLISTARFDSLHRELEMSCCVLYYMQGEDGHWYSTVESLHDEDSCYRNAEKDITAIIDVIRMLSPAAKAELDACTQREFNIGIECGDSWGYTHGLPAEIVRLVAEFNCSLAVTLYPLRNPDGSLKE